MFLSLNNAMLLKGDRVTCVITMNCNRSAALINSAQEGGREVGPPSEKGLSLDPWVSEAWLSPNPQHFFFFSDFDKTAFEPDKHKVDYDCVHSCK